MLICFLSSHPPSPLLPTFTPLFLLFRQVPVLAAVDGFGRVKLFNYPCPEAGAPDKNYKGHSAKVTPARNACQRSFFLSESSCATPHTLRPHPAPHARNPCPHQYRYEQKNKRGHEEG